MSKIVFQKILFVIPPLGTKGAVEIASYPHTGIGYLSSFMSEQGIENQVIDMRLGYSQKSLFNKINGYRPDLIAISFMTYKSSVAYELIDKIKEKNEIPIIVGGPHVSSFREKVLKECRTDYAVKGEGELTLLELCQGKDLPKIDGLIYRDGGLIIENRDRKPIEDVDAIPFPKYEKFELDKYAHSHATGGRGIPIISSRGCPYQCNFCSVGHIMGKPLRVRSAENIIKEMEYWYSKGIKALFFMDDNFTMDRNRIMELCRLIKYSKMENLRLSVPQGVRADKVDYESLKKMKEAGFWFLSFGVEAGNDRVLKRIKKHESIEAIENAIDSACRLNYDVGLFFIIGHPEERPEDFYNSLELAMKYPVSHAYFFHAVPFPGTELGDWVKENNYFVDDFDRILKSHEWFNNHPLFWTPYFSLKERRVAFAKAAKVSTEIKKNNMERKLRKRYGFWGRIITSLLYTPLIYAVMLRLYYRRLPRRMINFFLEKLKLRINQF